MIAYNINKNRMHLIKRLYSMRVKYKPDKQTCQTLRQNVVQLNKSVTNQQRQPLVLILLFAVLILLGLGFVTSCTTNEESAAPQAAPTRISAVLNANATQTLATKNAVVRAQPQPVMPTAARLANIVLIPTTTAAMMVTSPLPTAQVSAPLTTTIALQNRVAISVAVAAQSLLAAMQQPIYATVPVTIAVSMPVTTPSGLLPPLPDAALGALPGVSTVAPVSMADLPLANMPEQEPSAPLTVDGEVRTAHVPVLMYHYLSQAPPDADIYRRDLSVSPTLFAAHLDRIAAEGYTVIRLYDLIAYLTEGIPLPVKPVVLTFDDGYRDNYENALPLLRDHRMTATFFVVMEFINRERPEYLTWPMVQEMSAAGMSIEAHGVDHTTLRGRSRADLEFQALRSYETLQNALGIRAYFISYPAGEFDEQTIAAFQRADYWAGFTTIQGATHQSDDLFRLPRVRIRSTTTPDELARLLALDW